MPIWLFGRTGYSFLDYWTLGHFALWFWVGTITSGLRLPRTWVFCICFTLALVWEVVESPAEQWFPRLATHPESWWNRWISDPLMCVFALLIAWYGFDNWRSS